MKDETAAGAAIELSEWLRDDDCPAAAAVMLASDFARRGEHQAAGDVLTRAMQRRCDDDGRATENETDVATLMAAIASHILLGDDAEAARITNLLDQHHGDRPSVRRWLALIDPPGVDALPVNSPAAVDRLAAELHERLDVVPSLVAAQRIGRQAANIALLRDALKLVEPHVEAKHHQLSICAAIAELALLTGDADDARRWAHRGLKRDPYNATLALLVARIDDDEHVGPAASAVLARVLRQHPHYPDVRAALIRRQFADGKTEQARRRLRQWLSDEPAQPVAHRLSKELAA